MIKSDLIKIPFTNDNNEIENTLVQREIEPLRWAVINVENNELTISVSYHAC